MNTSHLDALHKLLLTGKRFLYKKGEVVQQSDTALHLTLVTRGYIKRYLITNEGSYGIQSIYGPGYVFPLTQVFELLFDRKIYSGPETYYYETMTDTEVYQLDNERIIKSVEENPLLYRDLLAVSGRRLHSNIHKLENMALHNAYQKVAHQIFHFAREFGKKEADGIKIRLPLTQSDIANTVSLTRETTSRCLVDLKNKKVIKGTKYITVRNIEALEKEAYGT